MYLDLLHAEDVDFVCLQEGFQLLLLSLGEEASSTVPPSKPQASSLWKPILLGFVYVAVENMHSLVAQVTLRAVYVVDLIELRVAVDNDVDAAAVRDVVAEGACPPVKDDVAGPAEDVVKVRIGIGVTSEVDVGEGDAGGVVAVDQDAVAGDLHSNTLCKLSKSTLEEGKLLELQRCGDWSPFGVAPLD